MTKINQLIIRLDTATREFTKPGSDKLGSNPLTVKQWDTIVALRKEFADAIASESGMDAIHLKDMLRRKVDATTHSGALIAMQMILRGQVDEFEHDYSSVADSYLRRPPEGREPTQ